MHNENPYRTSGFIDPQHSQYLRLYVQRPGLENKILSRLQSAERPYGCFAFGPRQSGKSSLLHHLSAQLQEKGWNCAYLTLHSLTILNQTTWYAALWQNLLAQLKPGLINHAQTPHSANEFEACVGNIAMQVKGLRVIVLIDEVDSIRPNDPRDDLWVEFLAMLRSLDQERHREGMQKWVFVLAAHKSPDAIVNEMPREWTEKVSPLFNTMQPTRLEDWGIAGTRQLTRLLEPAHSLDSTLPDRVHYWTNGHPYLTQHIFSLLYDQGVDPLTSVHVDQTVDQILQEPTDSNLGQHLANHLSRFDSRTKSLLLESTGSGCLWNESSEQQRQLYTLGLVTRSTDRKCSVIRNRIYERYVLAQYSRQELEGIKSPSFPKDPILFTQILTTFLPALLSGLGVFSLFSIPVLAAWKIGLDKTLSVYPWFPPVAVEALVGTGTAFVVYYLTYMLIWSKTVLSHRESKSLRLREINPNSPPMVLEFDAVAVSEAEWKLFARLDNSNWLYTVEIKGKPLDRVVWKTAECELGIKTYQGEITAHLTRAFNWKVLLCPWPDRWTVPLEITWSTYTIPVELHIIADASETFPKLVLSPLGSLRSAIAKVLESKPSK